MLSQSHHRKSLSFRSSSNETYNIRIYSIDGRLIVSNKEKSSEIDLSHMNAGIYLIKLTGEKGQYNPKPQICI
ncbi:T9SS type A sorting domain-containing protein [Candidatus Brachybacter algidus]|uniref:T9SS type A sorting domain-containing protein n=1 Tax=Candidatus Brachybacter algidus TaxID=2982024 RepID=UPI001DEB1FEB|nr:T9SS type A sorting domain-containing protein [Candidatus Brachybacter algidus]